MGLKTTELEGRADLEPPVAENKAEKKMAWIARSRPFSLHRRCCRSSHQYSAGVAIGRPSMVETGMPGRVRNA